MSEPLSNVSELRERKSAIQPHLISRAKFLVGARKKNRGMLLIFAGWVVLPTLLAMLYYFVIAADMYVSTTQLTVRDLQGNAGGLLDSVLGKSFGSNGNHDAQVVKEFLESRQVVEDLDRILDLRSIYGDPSKDIISRLSAQATNEALWRYFLGVSDVQYDTDSSFVTVKLRAFTPEQANLVARTMVDLADDLVKSMAEHARSDALAFARQELATAEARLREASLKVTRFRNAEQDINPGESAKAVLFIVSAIEQELVRTRAQFSEASSYLQPNSIALNSLKTRLAALEEQLRTEQARLAGEGVTYSKSLAAYEELNLDVDLARRGYAAAQAALDTARKEASQRTTYLVAFVKPNVPDEATYPRKLLSILAVFVGALISFGITTLAVASIREHASL